MIKRILVKILYVQKGRKVGLGCFFTLSISINKKKIRRNDLDFNIHYENDVRPDI